VKDDERRLVAALDRREQMLQDVTEEKRNLDEVSFFVLLSAQDVSHFSCFYQLAT